MKIHILKIPKYLQIFLPLIFIFSSVTVGQANTLSPARQIEVTVVSGKQLPLLEGQAFGQYSVMSISEGKLVPIPFQFDDRNELGLLYVPEGRIKVEGTAGIMEKQDELAIMLKDTGEKASAETLNSVSGTVIYELNIDTGYGNRYAYIVKDNPERSNFHYTFYDRETGLIKTQAYTLQVDPNNLLDWFDFTYHSFPEKRTLLDKMKLRMKAKLGFVKATISNKLIPARIIAVKNGPVKSLIEMDASISMLGINFLDLKGVVQASENTTEVPTFTVVPGAASVLSSLNIEVSLDFHNLEGSKVRTALGPKEPVIAGGGGANPKDLAVTFENNWLSGSSGKNFDIFAFFLQDKTSVLSLAPLYMDASIGSEADKPERFEGSHPQVGYVVSDIPTSVSALFGINLYYSEDFWQGNNPEKAAKEIANPSKVSATAI